MKQGEEYRHNETGVSVTLQGKGDDWHLIHNGSIFGFRSVSNRRMKSLLDNLYTKVGDENGNRKTEQMG